MRIDRAAIVARLFSLRAKLALLTTIGVLILLTLYYSLLSYAVVNRLAELDEAEAMNNYMRVMLAGQVMEDHLDAVCFTLSSNDAMYAFAESGDLSLVERKLGDDLFRMADLSIVYICRNDGTALWSRTYDSETKRAVTFEEFPAAGVPPDFPLLAPAEKPSQHWDGFFKTSIGPLQVVCRPILTHTGEGPVRGTVIVGRLADERRIAKMRQQTQVDFTIQDPSVGMHIHDLIAWLPVAFTGKPQFTYTRGEKLRVVGRITDTRGKALYTIYVHSQRPVTAAAASVMKTSIIFTVVAALAIIGILVFFVHILVEIPLKRIGAHMRRIEETAEPRVPFPYRFSGEFGRLAKSFTHMLNRLGDAQASLSDSELRYRSLTESAMDAIVSADADANIISWNKGAERMFGYSAAEMLGRSLSAMLPERHVISKDEIINLLERHLAEGPGSMLEFTGRRKDGTEFPLDMSAGKWETRDGQFYSGILRDTTLRKQALDALETARDAAEASNRAKTQFLASMSHEIRTPMNGVVGMAEILTATELTPAQHRCVDGIRQSAGALLDIINDVLDLSKIEADRVELEKLAFSPVDLVQQIVWSMQPSAQKKGLEFSFTAEENLPAYIEGDSARIRQILVNLAGNAIKFTEAGKCSISITRARNTASDESADTLYFAVRDTGIGVEPHLREAIFDRFSQADASITRKYGGTGLGLTICRRLAELMGGNVWCESEPGRGSTFFFSLPARTCDPPAPEEAVEAQIDLTAPMRRLRVLVAEDTSLNQELFSIFLEGLGHEVQIVENGQAALERLCRERFDVVLMDVEMPVMDGPQATRLLRKPESGALDPDIPVIAVTAHALIGDRERFLEAGMNEYVSKPIDFRALRAALQRVTSGRDYVLEDGPPPNVERLLGGRAAALARLGGSAAALARMDRIFVEDAPKVHDTLAQGVALRDVEMARRAAHSLKTMSATIGGTRLSQIAAELESMASAGQWNEIENAKNRLFAALGAALDAIAAESGALTPDNIR